ncbi:MAG: SMP-30/gluconolactonase/LRE family protein [Alphaproteobacteria bacterium]|jgi:gluconolactonase|nr:SMP-30/gluconolactonase/LRE family protein [Alphaproteobacteria bacterium]
MEALASGYGLIEGPVWDPARGLLFSDVIFGGVYCLSPDGAVTNVFPHRRGIGGMAPHADAGLVLSGRNVAYKAFAGGDTVPLLEGDAAPGILGFNDMTTDAAGRIYVGSLKFRATDPDDAPKPGHLHLIDLDGTSRILADGIMLTNGLGFSPDGQALYHADSRSGALWRYEVAADGGVGPRRVFAPVEDGIPDGLAVSEDGAVWVAMAHGGRVTVFEADGSVRRQIPVPLPMVTSVCFGGDALSDLYIVTGSVGAEGDKAGTVYRIAAEVPGLPVAPARVPLP